MAAGGARARRQHVSELSAGGGPFEDTTPCCSTVQATEDLYVALDARQQLLAAPSPGGDVLAAAVVTEADVSL